MSSSHQDCASPVNGEEILKMFLKTFTIIEFWLFLFFFVFYYNLCLPEHPVHVFWYMCNVPLEHMHKTGTAMNYMYIYSLLDITNCMNLNPHYLYIIIFINELSC